jgi:arylformamidase
MPLALLIDISPILDESIAVWPGDVPFSRDTPSDIRMTLHAGAHTDAPNHTIAGGADIASVDLDLFVGRCNVVHVRERRVLPSHIEDKRIDAPRVLFRTGTNSASLSPELIELLHARGVVLVGIDTPSVDPFESKELEVHKMLARYGMANLEGIVLTNVAEGDYELIALPLRIKGGDASPVRAVLRVLD